MRVGVALKPGTPVETVLPFAEKVDQVLVMTVEPGFGGQAFMPETMTKVKALRTQFPLLDIQVDGGLGPGPTIESAATAGANVIVAGTSIFSSPSPPQTILELRQTVHKVLKSSEEEDIPQRL
jgi:ribulose-phosphate 3-epimerase